MYCYNCTGSHEDAVCPEKDAEHWERLANKLAGLQAGQNDGRGVSCVQHVMLDLRRNNPEGARAICLNESDKIRLYPEIEKVICKELVELHSVEFFPCPHRSGD